MSVRIDDIQAAIPAPVRAVCERLKEAGHDAYAVGGAVRDVLLGRPIGDWDVATGAYPEEVLALFRRTIPTGLQHGTVTVLVGKGAGRMSIEVTTFRGEGGYSDGRHPDQVEFGVTLEEDLERRDFVVNAIAFDPVAGTLHDPFGGVDDLARRRLRAVGDPVARFGEDGLRVLRAVRFAATLEFELDPATEAAIPGALSVLARVSRERVRVELDKLLAAGAPSRGLVIAARTGILSEVFPELGDAWSAERIAAVDAAPPEARWAALLHGLTPAEGDAVARRLTLSNLERGGLVRLLEALPPPAASVGDAALRRRVGAIGRDRAAVLAGLWRALGADAALAERLRAVAASPAPVVPAELAIKGQDVMRILAIPAGPRVGEILRALFERVLDEPGLNQPAELERLVRELGAE